jgi:hypothetical protein
MKTSESISSRASINHRIERQLKSFNPTEQMRLLDALEAIKDAGESGLAPRAWAERIRALYPDGEFSVADLLKLAVKRFPFVIQRVGEGIYAWREQDSDVMEPDPNLATAMRGQVQLASMTMQIMKQLGEFTADDLAAAISRFTGMTPDHAANYAEHYISQFLGHTVQSVGDGVYRMHAEQPRTAEQHVQALKDLLRNAGLNRPQ